MLYSRNSSFCLLLLCLSNVNKQPCKFYWSYLWDSCSGWHLEHCSNAANFYTHTHLNKYCICYHKMHLNVYCLNFSTLFRIPFVWSKHIFSFCRYFLSLILAKVGEMFKILFENHIYTILYSHQSTSKTYFTLQKSAQESFSSCLWL